MLDSKPLRRDRKGVRKAIRRVAFLFLPVIASAQYTAVVNATLRPEPPSSAIAQRFLAGSEDHKGVFTRYLTDRTHHIYFGYDVVFEDQANGDFVATFGRLGLTPLAISARTATPALYVAPARFPRPQKIDPNQWTMQELPEIPKVRLMRAGDVVSILLYEDPTTGEKLYDDVTFQTVRLASPPSTPQRIIVGNLASSANPTYSAPSPSGEARDFTPADAELRFTSPRISLNGEPTSSRLPRNTAAAIVWIYIPTHGRFLMSLVPRPELGFAKAGEVRGGIATFTVGKDSMTIECPSEIVSSLAAYHLYVLADPQWEPVSDSQKLSVLMGTITLNELIKLR